MTKHIYIFYLTALFFGIQFIWSVEFSAGNPYLLHLGMSKAATPFVWAAGPISGLIVQPLVGYYSDTLQLPSNLKFGRRKPFLVLGTVAVSIGLFLIAYAPLLSPLNQNTSLYIAVGGFYILDFSVNILMASARSLLVDKLSEEDQIMGTSFAGRMLNAGDLCGYFIGGLDLVSLFPFVSSQMRILSWISLIILWISMSITLLFIK
jgi:solute carrier family 45 protein 1/2/4